MMSVSVAGRLPARPGSRPRRSPPPTRRSIAAGLAISVAGHALLAAVVALGLAWGVGARPKTYVVNLVPAVAAVGMPTAPRARTAPAPSATPAAPRVAEAPKATAPPAPAPLPSREPSRLPPAPPRPLPSREPVRLPEPPRNAPARTAALRPSDKESPPVAPSSPPAPAPASRAEPRPERPVPAEPPRPTAPPAVQGQRTGSPTGSGALTLDASDFPHAWYLRQVLQKVQGEWQRQPPVSEPDQRPMILVEIHRDGTIRLPKVEQSSGSAFYDQAAVRAVVAASPFPPLPADWSRASLRVMFRFELERG